MTGQMTKLFGAVFDATGALCAETDPEAFFPTPGDNQGTLQAKRVCNGCPLITECLTEAIVRKYDYGIWGGATPTERANMRRIRDVPLEQRIEKHIIKLNTKFADMERRERARILSESLRRSEKDKARRSLRAIEVGTK